MSKALDDLQFRALADSFIHLANESSETISPDHVSAALNYAASRYAAFVASLKSPSHEQYTASKGEAMEFFVGQYESMLRDNLDDHDENYEAHRQ